MRVESFSALSALWMGSGSSWKRELFPYWMIRCSINFILVCSDTSVLGNARSQTRPKNKYRPHNITVPQSFPLICHLSGDRLVSEQALKHYICKSVGIEFGTRLPICFQVLVLVPISPIAPKGV